MALLLYEHKRSHTSDQWYAPHTHTPVKSHLFQSVGVVFVPMHRFCCEPQRIVLLGHSLLVPCECVDALDVREEHARLGVRAVLPPRFVKLERQAIDVYERKTHTPRRP